MQKDLLKLLEEQAQNNTKGSSKEDYNRKQLAIKTVNNYLAVLKAKEALTQAGILHTKDNIVEYFINSWETNKALASEEEI